ncbi:ATP-binding protein [Brevibacillus dissolubilis]|uniref:ATP-binding protein n=1 Tax=Brevibacillus dissolubilis TaxID=1844116 RepID=UPI001116EA66|nr:ATP-binding protein [Brevibacillus dissolubilis]
MRTNTLHMSFHDLKGYQVTRDCMQIYLEAYAGEQASLVFIAANEAIYNALVHGCRMDPAKRVEIKLSIQNQKRLLLRIQDEGTGLQRIDFASLQKDDYTPDDTALYGESGRGLLIISKVFDRVLVGRESNQLLLIKNFPNG